MAKGYLYEVTYTEQGRTVTVQFITTSETITEDSRFGWADSDPNPDGTYVVNCGEFNYGIKNIVVEETSEFGRVDYNHTTGNKVIIDYWSIGTDLFNKISSVTDDFVPQSEGATYSFRTPSGRIEYVVGQTYSDGDGGYVTFSGFWTQEVNPEIKIWPGGTCRLFKAFYGGYEVDCIPT